MNLTDLIKVYDNALSSEFCAEIISAFENDTAGQFRRSDQQTWMELIVTHNPNPVWRGIEKRLVENMVDYLGRYIDDPVASILRLKAPRAFEHLKIKKYRPGQPTPEDFPTHIDAYNEKTAVRIVAFLWYLNDIEDGGATLFKKLGSVIESRTGRLAIFPPMWMYEHVGEAPVSNDKYVITSYLNFCDPELKFMFSYPLS